MIVDEKGLEIAKRDLLLARLELAALGLLWHDQIIQYETHVITNYTKEARLIRKLIVELTLSMVYEMICGDSLPALLSPLSGQNPFKVLSGMDPASDTPHQNFKISIFEACRA